MEIIDTTQYQNYKNDGKEYDRYAELFELDDSVYLGFAFAHIRDFETNPKINITIRPSESGSSGGLIMALAVYNALSEKDITGGLTIVGTGTINSKGEVGRIDGVEYKIKGAVKKGADIFFIPVGENYEEAKKVIRNNGYKITLVPVGTFDEALEYLMKNVAK